LPEEAYGTVLHRMYRYGTYLP